MLVCLFGTGGLRAWGSLLTTRRWWILRGPMGIALKRAANMWWIISRGRVDSGMLKTASVDVWILIVRVAIKTRLLNLGTEL